MTQEAQAASGGVLFVLGSGMVGGPHAGPAKRVGRSPARRSARQPPALAEVGPGAKKCVKLPEPGATTVLPGSDAGHRGRAAPGHYQHATSQRDRDIADTLRERIRAARLPADISPPETATVPHTDSGASQEPDPEPGTSRT